ncbi:MAG: aromatic ring-hydroxylating dioxygenase subunit alpha [Alphaproteobacteria bacterium]|nr:aromatic ring-hydroxylating dioxygenase subunit alpha [Alphaproteobacteria bacterium]
MSGSSKEKWKSKAARQQLVDMAKHNMTLAREDTIDLAPSVMQVPASYYTDEERYQQEVDKIFKRVPLMLATTPELSEPGDYKAMKVAGLPVLILRQKDGEISAFINSCSHRGAQIVMDGTGKAPSRLVCPYHAWTFDQKGKLVGVAAAEEFGEIDKSCYGLTELQAFERAGLIWVNVDPDSNIEIENFLAGYDEILNEFDFENWILFDQRTIKGPNWKTAYDGYLDLYHLPVLHKETFGPNMSNQAQYYSWGPHQRAVSPSRSIDNHLDSIPEDDWPSSILLLGVWTIFPHISIASFDGGGRGVMVSQLMPGETVGESYTTQYYLMETPPTPEQEVEANKQFKLLEYVVETEDYGTGKRQFDALAAGTRDHVLFGRNEGGGQRFHGWVDRLIEADDEELNDIFANAEFIAAPREAAE